MDSQKVGFVELVDAHQGLIHKVCILYETEQDAREDLFQEIVLQLWKSFPSFRGDSKITTWMYRIALNTAISALRKYKRKPLQKILRSTTLIFLNCTKTKTKKKTCKNFNGPFVNSLKLNGAW